MNRHDDITDRRDEIMGRRDDDGDPGRQDAPVDGPSADDGKRAAQEAHGGSMAPGLVDDTGHRVDAAGDDPSPLP